ncbi:MAG TPA: MFS transporter [Galbitalea sp.]
MTLAPATISTRRARVLIGQIVVKFALFATYAGMVSVLLPAKVAVLDPHDKVAALATIASIALVVTAFAQPVVGALSDRTATRFGRRTPWMVSAALIGGVAIGAAGSAAGISLLGIAWVIGQPSLKALEVSTDAYLVDAFPPSRRGSAAGLVGLALVAGTAFGAVLAASLETRPAEATWLLASVVVVAAVAFAVLVRDPPSTRIRRQHRRIRDSVRAVAGTVLAHPDYIKVLLWQVGFSIAYGVVFAYLLYIVTDLIGIQKVAAAQLIGLATVLGALAAALSVALGGWLSDRLGRRRPFILIGNVLMIVGDGILFAFPAVSSVLVTAVLFGIGLGLSISCGRALASQVLPNQATGAATGLGVLNTATSLGQAAAPVLGALVIGWGGYLATFVVSIVFAAACSVAIGLVKSVR